jgi:hypothetical protein
VQAQELLHELKARGVRLHALEDGRLGVEPGSVLNDELRAAIRANRDALLDALCQPSVGPCGELVIPFGADPRFRWWEASNDEDRRERFCAAREAAGVRLQ